MKFLSESKSKEAQRQKSKMEFLIHGSRFICIYTVKFSFLKPDLISFTSVLVVVQRKQLLQLFLLSPTASFDLFPVFLLSGIISI